MFLKRQNNIKVQDNEKYMTHTNLYLAIDIDDQYILNSPISLYL